MTTRERSRTMVKLAFCEPAVLGSLGMGNGGPGFANSPANRPFDVKVAYHTVDTTDDPATAAGQIERIELCRIDAMGTPGCPGTAPWLIFDRPTMVGSIDANKVFRCSTDTVPDPANPGKTISIPRCPGGVEPQVSVRLTDVDWCDTAEAQNGNLPAG